MYLELFEEPGMTPGKVAEALAAAGITVEHQDLTRLTGNELMLAYDWARRTEINREAPHSVTERPRPALIGYLLDQASLRKAFADARRQRPVVREIPPGELAPWQGGQPFPGIRGQGKGLPPAVDDLGLLRDHARLGDKLRAQAAQAGRLREIIAEMLEKFWPGDRFEGISEGLRETQARIDGWQAEVEAMTLGAPARRHEDWCGDASLSRPDDRCTCAITPEMQREQNLLAERLNGLLTAMGQLALPPGEGKNLTWLHEHGEYCEDESCEEAELAFRAVLAQQALSAAGGRLTLTVTSGDGSNPMTRGEVALAERVSRALDAIRAAGGAQGSGRWRWAADQAARHLLGCYYEPSEGPGPDGKPFERLGENDAYLEWAGEDWDKGEPA